MASDDRHAHREPAPPRSFELAPSEEALLGVGTAVALVVLAVGTAALTGRLFVVLFAALAPAVVYFGSGAPRSIDVRGDAVVVRYWLRPALALQSSGLM